MNKTLTALLCVGVFTGCTDKNIPFDTSTLPKGKVIISSRNLSSIFDDCYLIIKIDSCHYIKKIVPEYVQEIYKENDSIRKCK